MVAAPLLPAVAVPGCGVGAGRLTFGAGLLRGFPPSRHGLRIVTGRREAPFCIAADAYARV